MARKQQQTIEEVRADVRKRYLRGTRANRELVSFDSLTDADRWLTKERAALLKAAGFSYSYIGDAVGFSRSTIRSWFAEDPELVKRVEAFQKDFIDGAVKLVKTYAIELFEMLVEIARDERVDARTRIHAITECLDRMGLAKVNKSQSAVVKTEKHEWELTDRTGLMEAMKEAPPEVQQEMAAKLEEMMALAAEHTAKDVTHA